LVNDRLSFDTWYRAIIICEKRSIRNMIYQYKDDKIIFDPPLASGEEKLEIA